MSDDTVGAGFWEAYREEDARVRLLYSKVACALIIVLVPAGSLLELFVYPQLFWHIFKIRWLCAALTACILGLHFTAFGRRHIRIVGMWSVLAVQLSINYMIYVSEGAVSPYYAGLNLIILGAAVLLPWTFWETLFVCGLTLAVYLAACLFHKATLVNWGIFGNNLFFLNSTALICVTTSHFTARNRLNDFRLRYQLDIRNRELALSYERLAELDRLKSEFFANVSHELRTPLTLILSPLDALLRQDESLPEEVLQSLQIVWRNSLRLLKLINDLLEIVRLEESGLEAKNELVDLRSFLPGIADSVRHLAEGKGLALNAEAQEEPLVVEADPWQLEKVLLNLLTNAVKFTPAGGAITARCWREGSSAILEVEDTGPGIAEEDIPFVFDRFRQLDGSSTRRYQGLGIGLALARDIVEKHRGSLTARSELGKGATFRVALPASDRPAQEVIAGRAEATEEGLLSDIYREADRSVALGAEEPAGELPAVGDGQFTILAVEDEADMRRFLVNSLAPDYRVLQAADGETGLAMARKHMPDLVLLDLMLPGMDGLDVCRAIKEVETTRNIKVVLLTARADERSKIAALERRADDFLVKPFSTLEVKARLANLLWAAKLEKDLRNRNVELADALTQLKQTQAQLVQSEKMRGLGDLAAGLLHEINNPLNFTLTAVQLAREAAPEPGDGIAETLDDIEEGMVRIRDIITDLRLFAHHAQEELVPFRLTEAVGIALRFTTHELDGQTVSKDIPSGCTVLGSRNQIVHVLVNLLMNSSKALRSVPEDRKPEVRLSAWPEKGRLKVRVWDNGEGIERADLDRVFDPFFTTKDVGEGLGLGLSICHTIVKNHGGTISARSEEGEWTEVTFDLPLASEEVD